MRATIRQVAEQAGVSAMTVSGVLRGNPDCASAKTRERVLDVARALNYLPVNPPTSQNRHIETRVVTFVPDHHANGYFELDLFTYQGVVEGARLHGYDVFTMVGHEREKRGKREETRFLDRSSDGFIFNVILQKQWSRILDRVAQNRVPSVVCYHRDVPEGVAWVDTDNVDAMRQAVEHLVERGHQRIAFIGGPPDNFHEQQRLCAWREAMQKQGLEVPENWIVQGNPGELPDADAVASVTSLGVTAAVCFNDLIALAVWDATEARGLSVPNDLSLIGVDNRPEATLRGLSSINHSFIDVGRLAMDAWVELKNGGEATACCKLAPVQLIARQSVRTLNP
ncbi:transcriptional regulator, LacI family [Abditibacterium utsteinense]|uniref:Transcriptional regulator, LacI family n=1 Tax=Abditibacterium utsteinense TaxID=1960156 RepID=A0A2S8SQL0_9BACT|nr:LacI family DNA-binding transcriptional regulator [Abditibacterium utsteinense]PQV63092.1 transcriptional regulator, LacI family [Abditibacterium utsteinense]